MINSEKTDEYLKAALGMGPMTEHVEYGKEDEAILNII